MNSLYIQVLEKADKVTFIDLSDRLIHITNTGENTWEIDIFEEEILDGSLAFVSRDGGTFNGSAADVINTYFEE